MGGGRRWEETAGSTTRRRCSRASHSQPAGRPQAAVRSLGGSLCGAGVQHALEHPQQQGPHSLRHLPGLLDLQVYPDGQVARVRICERVWSAGRRRGVRERRRRAGRCQMIRMLQLAATAKPSQPATTSHPPTHPPSKHPTTRPPTLAPTRPGLDFRQAVCQKDAGGAKVKVGHMQHLQPAEAAAGGGPSGQQRQGPWQEQAEAGRVPDVWGQRFGGGGPPEGKQASEQQCTP